MASDKTESDGFLAMIDAKIAALQALADSYRAAMLVGAIGQSSDGDGGTFVPPSGPTVSRSVANAGPVELPTGAFRGTGIAAAVRMYLDAARRKQTFKQISEALREGGIVSTSSDFEKTLNTTLHRLKGAGELIQFPDGWDLANSYPESFKQRLAKDAAPKAKAKGKAKKAKAKNGSAPKVQAKTGAAGTDHSSPLKAVG